MNKEDISSFIRRHFPVLGGQELADAIASRATALTLPPGKVLLNPGESINLIPLVVKGSVKVVRADDSGHEILLYYIHPGESCAMTLSSCLKREKSRIKAVAQQKTEVIGIDAGQAYMLGRKYPAWFDFVLGSYAQRFDELLEMLDAIGFSSLDERLVKYLKEKSELLDTLVLHLSHQEIADDLGTARAVVSRMLKQMERKGMLRLQRGRIRILALV